MSVNQNNVEQEALQKGKKKNIPTLELRQLKLIQVKLNYRYKISQGIVFLE